MWVGAWPSIDCASDCDAAIVPASMSTPVRIGVAGLGRMGLVHARNALASPGAELAAAAARPGRAAAVARELGVRALSHGELLADADVEAVVLAARSVDHARVA